MSSAPQSPRRTPVSLAEFLGTPRFSAPSRIIGRHRISRFLSGREVWSVFLPALDYIVLLAALAVISASWLHGSGAEFLQWEKFLSTNAYVLSILVTIAIANGYRPKEYVRRLGFAAEYVLSTVVGSAIGLFVIYALFPGSLRLSQESRAVLLLGAGASLVPGLAVRITLARIRDALGESRPFLVIGKEEDGKNFAWSFQRTGLPNPLVFINTSGADEIILDAPPPNTVRESFEGIILTGPLAALPPATKEWLLDAHTDDIPVYTLRSFYASVWRQSPVLDGNPDWIFEQDFRLAERSYYRIVKRVFDLLSSTTLLVLTLPLLILTAILIKLDSRGPVFFCQERVGRQRRVFNLYKFRTMHIGAEAGPLYTAKNDPRITRVGALLRRLRIDELPQLINIWRGDMSLIGPRPEWKVLVDTYEREIPGYHLRHLVSPGITGWAQLNHPYGESVDDTVEKLKFDLYYIQFYSPVLDLEIVLKTIVSIMLLKGR
jgi:exopolysaccharide biosynthesis polyprenyl glycosylphosphotransferase